MCVWKLKKQDPFEAVLTRCYIQKKHHLGISKIVEKLFKCVLKPSEEIFKG